MGLHTSTGRDCTERVDQDFYENKKQLRPPNKEGLAEALKQIWFEKNHRPGMTIEGSPLWHIWSLTWGETWVKELK